MKSLEQLHEICERMRKVVQLREENAKEILEKAAMCESGKDADGNTYRTHVLVCGGTGCTSSGSARIRERLEKEIEANGLSDEVCVVKTGCFGLCALGPIMIVYPGRNVLFYGSGRRYSGDCDRTSAQRKRGKASAL